jgi:hypothetical protein
MAWTWLHTRKALPTVRSVRAVLDGRRTSAAAQRHPIDLDFDIVEGASTKQMATAAAAACGVQHASWKMATGRRGSSRTRTEHLCGVLGAAPRAYTQWATRPYRAC